MATAKKKVEAKEEVTEITPFVSSDIGLSSHQFQTWRITAPLGFNVKCLELPETWRNIAARLRVHDEISVVAADSAWYAKLLVTFVTGNDLRVKLIEGRTWEEQGDIEVADGNYEVKFLPQYKHHVRDIRDGSVVPTLQGFASKAEAYKQLDQYIKTLNS